MLTAKLAEHGAPRSVAATSASRAAGVATGLIVGAVLLGLLYNALLAAVAARGGPASYAISAAAEIAILGCAALGAAIGGLRSSDWMPLGFIYISAVMAVVLSIAGDHVEVAALRNFLIIGIFTIAGSRLTVRQVRALFAASCVLVLAVLALEVLFQAGYVSVFSPATYLEKTRGFGNIETNDTGLAAGTIAYEGRFSLGLYSGPRTSSLFLEQVSINAFAIVAMVFFIALFETTNRREKWLTIVTVGAIIATNNSRMASLFIIISALGFYLFPKLPRFANIALIPIVIAGVFTLFIFIEPRNGDDLLGRISVAYNTLSHFNIGTILGLRAKAASVYADSGYAFLLASAGLLGALIYWLYVSFIVPQKDPARSRLAWGLGAYVSLWLLVGGTGAFSLKTACLLWLLVGLARSDADLSPRLDHA